MTERWTDRLPAWYTTAAMELRRDPLDRLLAGPLLRCLSAVLVLVPLWPAAASQRTSAVAAAAAGMHRTVTVLPADPLAPPRPLVVALLADTPVKRVQGLQGFRMLARGEAALFVIDPPQQVSFWMAGLHYAIDIIYVNEAGVVTEVFLECQPQSQELFSSAGPVRWVIETMAGSGIRPGDRVRVDGSAD